MKGTVWLNPRSPEDAGFAALFHAGRQWSGVAALVVSRMKRMKSFWLGVVVALLCGCAVDRSLRPTGAAAGPIDQVAAKSIAECEVKEREHWERVVSDARRVEQGWKVLVERRPYKPSDWTVNVTLDDRGQVLDYDKFQNLK